MTLSVIKIGGNIIDDPTKLASFLGTFTAIADPKILVHGGGKVATDIGRQLGIEPKYADGRRITDAATLHVVTMVYGGLINKQITAQLQALRCNAIGLTGADASIIPAQKRPVKDIDFGYVGDVASKDINTEVLRIMLDAGLTPVLAPLTHDGNGQMLNTNADTIAQEVAKALAVLYDVQLIYCFEKKGVLADPANEDSVISKINAGAFERLKASGIIFGGMIPKLENALAAINSGVERVVIGNADELAAIVEGKAGTCITQ